MNILFFTPQLPYPTHQGTTIRNFHILKHLARQHTVDLLTFVSDGQRLEADCPLHRFCRRIEVLPQPRRSLAQRGRDTLLSPKPDMGHRLESQAMRQLVERYATENQYDLIQIEGIEMAQYGLQALKQSEARSGASEQTNPKPILIFDDHNCEYLLQKRNCLADLRQPKRWVAAAYSLVQWQKLYRYETTICRRADAISACSDADRLALLPLAPQADICVIPNGIDLEAFHPLTHLIPLTPSPPHPLTPPTLVFTGKMDYRPNIDAVLWFADEVLPLIQQKRAEAQKPAVRFQIVGMKPHARLDPLRSDPAIEITGAVTDVRPFIHQAAAYVIPLRIGGGTRFKALEAMACGRPIVSTTLGVEGIGVTDGCELLLADDPPAFAQAVLRLLDDVQDGIPGEMTQRLAQNARQFVETHFGWEQITPRFEQMYSRVRSQKSGVTSH